ncbi:hypothetical protein MCNF_55200 [Mycolicibacterium confluentis]|uniref:Mutator family transposase n=1 Tax=Mycolicibacterium confluentis TaxID=28047 RepID=A0A7I7Y5F4_9MYCO|nr:hypothetical protein MCNF_55200 [Mycolicibacterium confluentis]
MVSTRRMDKLVETLGITGLSKSQVSVMANELDAATEAFTTRNPLKPVARPTQRQPRRVTDPFGPRRRRSPTTCGR